MKTEAYTYRQMQYIRALGGKAHQAAIDIIGELEAEVDRLKSGDFTEQEFQGLCHKFQDADADRFANGCVEYMNKLFGHCPLAKTTGS